jgi:hypothetical protein
MATAITGTLVLEKAVALDVPPRWAVAAVKTCVIGMFLLPLVIPLVMVGGAAFLDAQAETFRMAGSLFFIALWVTMAAFAKALTSHYPPVPRR